MTNQAPKPPTCPTCGNKMKHHAISEALGGAAFVCTACQPHWKEPCKKCGAPRLECAC